MSSLPRLYMIADGPVDVVQAQVEAALAAGVKLIQLRFRELKGDAIESLAREVKSACDTVDAALLLNSRVKLAAKLGLGVHLNSRQPDIRFARRMLGDDALVAQSCHHFGELTRAKELGADFAVFGPIFSVPGKAAAVGVDELADVCRAAGLPIFALGGVVAANAQSCLAAGAAGIAGIRAFADAAQLTALQAATSDA